MPTTSRPDPRRILVVDDQSSDTQLVKQFLEETGDYLVREVNASAVALAAAEEFQPHLILLDVMMPGLNGADLAALLQASPRLQAVPIVFLTALVTKEDLKSGVGRIGRFPFLAKPIVLADLRACLRRLLGG